MRRTRNLGTTLAAASLVCVPVIAFAAPASAGPSLQEPLNTLVTEGSGLCYGNIRGNVDEPTGRITLTFAFYNTDPTFVADQPSDPDSPCRTTAYITWQNLGTGATGEVPLQFAGAAGSIIDPDQQLPWYDTAQLPTEPGHYKATVTTKEQRRPDSVSVEYSLSPR
ncbi:hypothetical protein HGA13_27640 [Nocardia speluncae]|uniref:Uncharacterized protein n=1 Tax=Nocardia speluncae TaxID=419477 RepID=A0A846XTC9_9NOCA|nr:hypothetical protein [Nocardia speluncae]NKY36814.1 hypothetical protein [Nocardia speluncae]